MPVLPVPSLASDALATTFHSSRIHLLYILVCTNGHIAQDSTADDGPSASNTVKRKRPSSPQVGRRRSTRSQDNNNDDNDNDEDDDSDDESQDVRPRRSGKSLPQLPIASATTSTRRTSGKTVSAASRGRKTLRAVSNAATRRRRHTGFTVSHNTGVTSEEDQDDEQLDLAPFRDEDHDSDEEDREGSPPRTRSVSIAGVSIVL